MSSFSNVTALRHLWRTASFVAAWFTGILAVACVAAAVVLGGATAAVQRAGVGVADASAAWMTVGVLFVVGLLLGGVTYLLFVASEPPPEQAVPRPPAVA